MRNFHTVQVERHSLTTEKLSKGSSGFSILQFSDLHWRHSSPGKIETALLHAVAETEADLLIFSGDTVNRNRYWPNAKRFLKQLDHPGVKVAVPGNWDYTKHGLLVEFCSVWEECGFEVLLNETKKICIGEVEMALSGMVDPRVGAVCFDSCLHLDPSLFHLMVCHSPDVMLEPGYVPPDLLLCGHTHGGQIRIPGWGAVVTSTQLGRKFDKGLFEPHNSQYVFVQSGIGMGELPIRIACPPCISLLEVKPPLE